MIQLADLNAVCGSSCSTNQVRGGQRLEVTDESKLFYLHQDKIPHQFGKWDSKVWTVSEITHRRRAELVTLIKLLISHVYKITC